MSPDLIDYEYAVCGSFCGDNVVNTLNEECDDTADAACPGPGALIQREKVIVVGAP